MGDFYTTEPPKAHVKIFSVSNAEGLETKLNEFMQSDKVAKVIYIKYATAVIGFEVKYTAMVAYFLKRGHEAEEGEENNANN